MKPLSRRTVLRGAGALVALPFLQAMQARAQSAPPVRLVTVFTANGTVYDRWLPLPTATGFTLSPILAPLAAYQARLLVPAHLDLASCATGLGDGHQRGIGQLWTGTALQPGTLFGRVDWAGGPSFDQLVADRLGTTTALRSLELGVQVPGARIYDRMIYRAAGQPVPPELDPRAVFDRLFGADTDPLAAARRRAHRHSVLDAVLDEYRALSPRLPAADQRKLDEHATTIRELERRLEAVSQPAPSCARPAPPAPPALAAGASYPELGRLMMDLLALALTCDLTRVASLQWSSAASPVVFTWLGQTVDHHELSHRADTDTDAHDMLAAIHTWYSQQLATLLDRLAAVDEGGRSLLDDTVVVWGNELGKGNAHNFTSAPFVVAGGGGRVRTGQLLETNHAPHNALLLGVMRALGLPDESFGDPAFCPGVLGGML